MTGQMRCKKQHSSYIADALTAQEVNKFVPGAFHPNPEPIPPQAKLIYQVRCSSRPTAWQTFYQEAAMCEKSS